MFSKNSIFIGSQSTNGLSSPTDLGFELATPNYPRKTCFLKTRFSLVPSRPMGFRGKRTSDSNSPLRITPGKHVFQKLHFCWFPSRPIKKRTNGPAISVFYTHPFRIENKSETYTKKVSFTQIHIHGSLGCISVAWCVHIMDLRSPLL